MASSMEEKYIRYYNIADITIQVESDLPILDKTFNLAIREFEVDKPGEDVVVLRHHFLDPFPSHDQDGTLVYDSPIWRIFKRSNSWVYKRISPKTRLEPFQIVAEFYSDYHFGEIYHAYREYYLAGNVHSLTLFNTDQLYITQLLAPRSGLYLHSSGVVINGKGILFVGHSSAGKSTIVQKLIRSKIHRLEVLCDDRNILRLTNEGFSIFGTWDHGTIHAISPATSPLNMICFLEKSSENYLTRLKDTKFIRKQLLAHLVSGYTTPLWWDQTLPIINKLVDHIPTYQMSSDKSNLIVSHILEELGS